MVCAWMAAVAALATLCRAANSDRNAYLHTSAWAEKMKNFRANRTTNLPSQQHNPGPAGRRNTEMNDDGGVEWWQTQGQQEEFEHE